MAEVMTPEEYFASRGFKMDRNRKWDSLVDAQHAEAVAHGRGMDCPRCAAKQTYRAYAGHHKRWLCKYCGYFFGGPAADPAAMGEFQCYPNAIAGVWSGPGAAGNKPTPLEMIWPTWPWRH
jgi:ribosomal protein L37AE/L43A